MMTLKADCIQLAEEQKAFYRRLWKNSSATLAAM
jgi:hypothetical protein